ncbi:CcmD family protein [Natronolimnobius sp. AArcel1]|uniref:CcmD family protein n=1 Tax=Natronolimnobius sp. AArcel1 TaxID=1679093 RepID=UPI0013E9A3CD|nr:CcmD family protein [Natronolimnobius sp. AArcel1]NGM70693.1 CcmD family protein [Natronolimnobius sp. AArcel1]
MEYLLLAGYGAIFIALVVYVFHLRSQLTELEQRFEDVVRESDIDSLEGDD